VGTVMVREHRGTLHEVMVVPGGFHWQGKIHASLSTIARGITGTAWNGPRFFGLRGKAEPGVPDKSAIEPVGQDARLFVRGARCGRPAMRRSLAHEDREPETIALRHLHAEVDRA
jgi:hypothetical protein